MSGISRPKDEQIRQVLALLGSVSTPIFVHCQYGCDRTGTVIACYRILHDGWSSQLALREAERYGFSKFEGSMKRFIVEFGHSTKPELREASSN
jgi:protein tyrosine/serine phosphatase